MIVHVTEYKPLDFTDLQHLPEDVRKRVEQARIEARDIQKNLEPSHINSWSGLIEVLDESYRLAIMNAEFVGGFDVRAHFRRMRREERVRLFRRVLRNLFNFKKKPAVISGP